MRNASQWEKNRGCTWLVNTRNWIVERRKAHMDMNHRESYFPSPTFKGTSFRDPSARCVSFWNSLFSEFFVRLWAHRVIHEPLAFRLGFYSYFWRLQSATFHKYSTTSCHTFYLKDRRISGEKIDDSDQRRESFPPKTNWQSYMIYHRKPDEWGRATGSELIIQMRGQFISSSPFLLPFFSIF